jgi:hypothetical protein
VSEFLQIKGPDDEAGIDRLLELGRLDHTDMGPVLVTFRAWPGPLFWVPFAALCCFPVVMYLTAPGWDDPVLRAGLAAIPLVMLGLPLVAVYALERHRVCEHGLVVGFKKESRYVIPWATVDPGRVRIAKRMGLLGRRPDVPQGSPRYRVGAFSLHGVVLNGLDTTLGSRWDTVMGPNPVHSPFGWWLLATRRAPELVAAIEAAMVADGYPAQGLAARAQAQEFTVTWKPAGTSPIPPRLATDPVIGVDGPLMV